MSDNVPPQDQKTLYDTLSSWGQAVWDYASSLMQYYTDLEVVNPDSSDTEQKQLSDHDIARQKEFTSYKDYIGKDITSLVALPVFIMEPSTILQKMGEMMEYVDLLDKADDTEDEFERFALVVAFFLSPFSNIERPWKPFNPILGETFEVSVNDVNFMSEQVSHHPPIGAAHAENNHFEYDQVSAPTTKLLGNSIDIYPVGRTRLKLKKHKEQYWHSPPNTKAHNIILGRTWIDAYGDFVVANVTTGSKCHLYFTPCGWFSSGRYEFSGHITDKDGVKKMALSGKWNSYCDAVKCDDEGNPLAAEATKRLWQAAAKPENDKYNYTYFARKLNEGVGIKPLPSDSRRRPDRAALEAGEMGKAGDLKYKLEEMQRTERKEREKRGETWAPKYWKKPENAAPFPGEYEEAECPSWEWNGEYNKLPKPVPTEEDPVKGSGFCPWQYPELHQKM